MFNTVKDIILINAYWFSLPMIGYVLLRVAKDIKLTPKTIKDVAKFALRQHPFFVFVLSFAVTVLLLAFLSIFFYIFHLSVVVPVLIYIALLLVSLLYLSITFIRVLFDTSDIDIFRLRNQTLFTKILFLIMCLALVADFFMAIYAKSFTGGDAIYHMSRVVSILSDGYNVQSSFFNNLPEGAYHYNVVYTLYVIPSKLLHLEPMRVWEYSLGFYRLLIWLSIFTLAMHVFGNWLKTNKMTILLSALSVLLAMASYSFKWFFIANYPNQLVNVWLILLVICLSFPLRKNIRAIGLAMISLGFLLTMTHSIYSLMAALFVGLFLLTRAILIGRKFFEDKASLAVYLVTMLVLLISPAITKFMPVRLSSKLVNLDGLPTIKLLGMQMMKPDIQNDLLGWTMFIAVILIVSFVLIKLWKSRLRLEWALVFTLSTFYILIAYIPIIFVIFSHFVPVWVIGRFNTMDVLSFLLPTLGLYTIYCIAMKLVKAKVSVRTTLCFEKVVIVTLAVLLMIYGAFICISSYRTLLSGNLEKEASYTEMRHVTKDFKNIMVDNKLIVTNASYSYYLASLFNIDVIAVEYGHSALASDGDNRTRCEDYIMKNLNYVDFKAINANYLVVSSFDDMKDETNLADSKPYLELIEADQYFKVYKFEKDLKPAISDDKPYGPCLLYQQNESK